MPTLVIEDEWPCRLTDADGELVSWMPKAAGGGTAVVRGRCNYAGQVTVEIGNEMTVLFDAVYGTDGDALRVMTTQEPGKPYVFPTTPIYRGHAFLGWFTARSGGSPVAPGTRVSLVVGAKGKTKVAGTLADGTRVSASTQLLVGERECAVAVSWTKKGASLVCLVWFCEDGSVECGNLSGGVTALVMNARAGAYLASGAAFRLDADRLAAAVPGMRTELAPDGLAVRMRGTAFDIGKAGKVKLLRDKSGIDPSGLGVNPSGLTLRYKMKTGSFTGSFTVYSIVDAKLKKKRAQVSGVVLGGKGYGTAIIRGFGSCPITIE